jgi:uncharacterized RDD family membrane protein YckC
MSLPENAAFVVKGDDGKEYGPVDLADLREWVRESRAGLGTSVRLDEPGAIWQPWQYYPELVALLAEAQATGVANLPGALVVAPLLRRTLAFALDLILAYILLIPIILIVWIAVFPDAFVQCNVATQRLFSQGQQLQYSLPPLVQDTMQLIFAAGITLYMAGFHFAHGQTPAKSIMRLRVVDRNGEKPNAATALVRGLVLSFFLLLLSFFPFLFFLPLLYAFLNPQRRALHDLVAGTYVVEA